MEFIRYHRVPANWSISTTWTQKSLPPPEVDTQVAYDKEWRWGQSLFVNGKCVHVSEFAGHTPEDIAAIEAQIAQAAPVPV